MTTDTTALVRAWVAALAAAGLLALWALVGRDPFPTRATAGAGTPAASAVASVDPRVVALRQRERALRVRAAGVRRRLALRQAQVQRVRLQRVRIIASTPSSAPSGTSFVSSPSPAPAPVVTTRSS